VIKYTCELTGQEVTFTVSEELTKLCQGKVFAPKKLAEANEILRNCKTPRPK
jgi:hypothetical protein